jgi:hypothetical protein
MGSGSSKPTETTSQYKPSNSVIGVSVSTTPYTVKPALGAKKALLIGCNYINTSFSLNGCVNDVNTVSQLLSGWGYQTTLMTDYTGGELYPTRNNIIKKLNDMVLSLQEFDTLVIYYSGHGSSIADTNGDEVSGKDSTIVPIDVRSQGYIVDDTIRSILIKAVENSNILGFFDSCNSGSVCDLRYNYFDTSYRAEPFLKQKIYENPNIIPRYNSYINNRYPETEANIITLSGCKDNEYSYEMITSNGNAGGALTYSVISCLKSQTPDITFAQLLSNVRNTLLSLRLSQNPSLMGGRNFNPDTLKVADFMNI